MRQGISLFLLTCIFLVTSDRDHLLSRFFAICLCSLENMACAFSSFSRRTACFLNAEFWRVLCIFGAQVPSPICNLSIFPYVSALSLLKTDTLKSFISRVFILIKSSWQLLVLGIMAFMFKRKTIPKPKATQILFPSTFFQKFCVLHLSLKCTMS